MLQKIKRLIPYINTAGLVLLFALVVLPEGGVDTTPTTSDSPTFEVPLQPGVHDPLETCEMAAKNDAVGVLPTDGGLRYLAQYGVQTIEWVRNPNVNNSLGFIDGVDTVISEEVKKCLIENASVPD